MGGSRLYVRKGGTESLTKEDIMDVMMIYMSRCALDIRV